MSFILPSWYFFCQWMHFHLPNCTLHSLFLNKSNDIPFDWRLLQVYYPVRHHLVQHMISAMQRLGFTPSVTIEQRKLAVDLAEVVIKWELQRIKDQQVGTCGNISVTFLLNPLLGHLWEIQLWFDKCNIYINEGSCYVKLVFSSSWSLWNNNKKNNKNWIVPA